MDCDPTIPAGTGPVHERHHGCVFVTCSGDAECDPVEACVNARCQSGPGICMVPVPMG